MKKITLGFVLLALVFSGLSFARVSQAAPANISELIELLITVGVIGKDKAAAARAVGKNLTEIKAAAATSTAYLQVLSPNGGESFELDQDVSYEITWGANGISAGNVAFVMPKNVLCNLSPVPMNFRNGENEIDIWLKKFKCYDNFGTLATTTLPAGSYKIRVYGKDELGFEIKDESNGAVKVIAIPVPELKLSYPNGGEKLSRKEEYIIKYTIKNFDKFSSEPLSLSVLNNEGTKVYGLKKALKENGQLENFKFPSSLPAGAYRIKISAEAEDGAILEDTSDNLFWLSTGL